MKQTCTCSQHSGESHEHAGHPCSCGHDHHESSGGGLLLIRMAVTAVLLGAGMLTEHPLLRPALCAAAYLAAGCDVLLRAGRNILKGRLFDEHFLMSAASLGAMLMGEYAEAAAVMALYQLGEYCQDKASERSRRSIAGLMDIRPDEARVLRSGSMICVKPEDVAVGELIQVRPGEKIPLDGVVESGTSTLNTAALTGESLPRDVSAGDQVLSGCVNQAGLLTIRVTTPYGESTAAKILELVEHSGRHKARTERLITRFARVYTPLVCLAALMLAVIPSLLDGQWMVWVRRALTFLVISCPCALVISVPLSFFSGIGRAAARGILIKGANHIETLARVDTLVLDKTGTLTRGVFRVQSVHSEGIPERMLLEKAALAEMHSGHPISRSLLDAWDGEADASRVSAVEELAGRGVKAVVDSRLILAGNARMMEEAGVDFCPLAASGTVVYLAEDGAYLGCIVIADELKPEAPQAMAELRALGVEHLVMLTGDREEAAKEAADAAGMTDVHAGLLPEGKVHALETLLQEGRVAAFAGDGINDAPVIRRADAGIAMGVAGSDAAMEAADIVLMNDDLRKLPEAVALSRRTLRIARQNIMLALGVKALVLLLSALGLADMWMAVFADVGVAMIAIFNAVR